MFIFLSNVVYRSTIYAHNAYTNTQNFSHIFRNQHIRFDYENSATHKPNDTHLENRIQSENMNDLTIAVVWLSNWFMYCWDVFLINECYFWNTCTQCLGCHCVKITNLEVPTTYEISNSSDADDLVLDCEFELDAKDTGFVLKWLLDDQAIYQWIPGHKPYALVKMCKTTWNLLWKPDWMNNAFNYNRS